LFGGRQSVRRLAVAVGDHEYELENVDGHISCVRRNVVRGIALKSDQLSLEEWVDSLAQGLVDEAGRTESDRLALERMLTR
jgi:hypothetical protein